MVSTDTVSSAAQDTPAHLAAMQALLGVKTAKPEADAHLKEEGAHEDADVVKLFFVRVPRSGPREQSSRVKELQDQFHSHVEVVKAANARLGAKREAMRNLRSQMSEAKAIRDAAQPEFNEKLNGLKQLREQANTCKSRISEIRDNVKGLDCKTERDLDVRIKQEEDKIRFGSVTLREEKMVLAELGKLKAQRSKIQAFEQGKGSLVELEAELTKIKAQIQELENDFNVVKGERDAAAAVVTDFYAKLKVMEKDFEAEELRQKEATDKKNVVHAQLEAAKQEQDAGQVEYRDNRKFSLSVREMVDRGEVDEARELCAKQTDEMITRFMSDRALWSAYCECAAEQRRSPVSPLLPASTKSVEAAAPAEPAAQAAAAQPAGKASGKKAAAAAAAPAAPSAPKAVPVPDGAGKAKDLIASIMTQAKSEAARLKASIAETHTELGSDDASEGPEAHAAEAAKPAAKPAAEPAPKAHAFGLAPAPGASQQFVQNPAARAAEVFGFKMEMPKVADVDVLPLPPKPEQQAKTKDEVREEQRLKAEEAEAKKQKRQEVNEKKKVKAAEAAKLKAEEERRAAAQAAAAAAKQAQQQLAIEAAQALMQAESDAKAEAVAGEVTAAGAEVEKATKSAGAAAVPASKRPAAKASLLRRLRKICKEHQTMLVIVAVLVLFIALLMAASV